MTTLLQWRYVVVLALIWATVLCWQVIRMPEQQEVPLKFKSGDSMTHQTPGIGEVDSFVIKPISTRAGEIRKVPRKNIFSPLNEPAIRKVMHQKPIKQTPSLESNQPIAAQPPPQPVPVQASPPPVPQPSGEELAVKAARQKQEFQLKQIREAMAEYRYIGYLNRNGVEEGFLGKGQELYILKEGDKLEDKFNVIAIDAGSLTLREPQARVESTIRIKQD